MSRGRVALLGGGGFIGRTFVRKFGSQYERLYVVDRFSGPAHPHPDAYARFTEEFASAPVVTYLADVAQVGALGQMLGECETILLLNADTGTANSFEHPGATVQQNINVMVAELEAIRRYCDPKRARVLFTSSRAVYGEGNWKCPSHGQAMLDRSAATLAAGHFEPKCPECGRPLVLEGSREDARNAPLSVYGATKCTGEDLLATVLVQAGFDVRIVRFQNVYGPGQAIGNPYTGVLNWFSLQLTAGEPVDIYERGFIVRDFIFVEDAARLLNDLARLERPVRQPLCVNGGSGQPVGLKETATLLKEIYGSGSEIRVCEKFRVGDVLGARADMTRARELLGFECETALRVGLTRYAQWFRGERERAGAGSNK